MVARYVHLATEHLATDAGNATLPPQGNDVSRRERVKL